MAQANMKEFCNEISKEYAECVKDTPEEKELEVVKRYIGKKDKILDLCCGPGRYLIPLTRSRFMIDGIDFSPGMIDQAKKYAKEKNVRIRIEQGDATSIDRRDASYDVILFLGDSVGSIPGKANRQKAIEETYRILKPNGMLICTVGNRNVSFIFFLQHISQYILNVFDPHFVYGDRRYEFLGSRGIHHDYSKKEIEALFRRSKFEIIESIAGEGDMGHKLIYVCKK